jgi:hypothetical protein
VRSLAQTSPRGNGSLLDTSGAFSDRRFPGSGTVAQTALLLLNEIADRIEDLDAPTEDDHTSSPTGCAAPPVSAFRSG